nr:Chain C, LCMV peptidic epitope gp276 [synthetic construct]
SGVENPGGYCL